MNPTVEIRPLRQEVSIREITALLHAAYAPLAAMGFRYLATHQDDATTARRLHAGFPLVAECAGTIVGTITLCAPDTQSDCIWYRQPGVFTFGQYAVRPPFQCLGIGSSLISYVEALARAHGALELALDTSEGATHLIRWYQMRGYRFTDNVSWDGTNYRSVILSKTLAGRAGVPLIS